MPKKISTNPKALEARSRQEEKKRSETEKKEKEAEDALWKDDDKDLARKQKRKEEQEKKKQELAERKAAAKAALDEEMASLKGKSTAPKKVTKAEIQEKEEKRRLQMEEDRKAKELQKQKIVVVDPLVENINRIQVEGDEARTIDEAIAVLSVDDKDSVDKHPEKRMKAAYLAFEERRLPELKAECPNQKLSQLKQQLKKEWNKSPDNPLNQAVLARATR